MRSGGGTDGPGGPGLVVWTGTARAARDGELCLLGHPPTPSGDGDPRQLLRGVALRLARSCSLHIRAATRAGGTPRRRVAPGRAGCVAESLACVAACPAPATSIHPVALACFSRRLAAARDASCPDALSWPPVMWAVAWREKEKDIFYAPFFDLGKQSPSSIRSGWSEILRTLWLASQPGLGLGTAAAMQHGRTCCPSGGSSQQVSAGCARHQGRAGCSHFLTKNACNGVAWLPVWTAKIYQSSFF